MKENGAIWLRVFHFGWRINMLSDIEIAQKAKMLCSMDIAEKAGIDPEFVEPYGNCKAKIGFGQVEQLRNREDGKLILVTALNPTPAGRGGRRPPP